MIPSVLMDEPPKYLLVFAYLSALIDREKSANATYVELERGWAISKTNLIKVKGDELAFGTLGPDLLFRVADAKFSGSVDLIVSHARYWWSTLTPEKRKEELTRMARAHEQRTKRGRQETGPKDQAEIDRLRDGLTVLATSESRPITPAPSSSQVAPKRSKRR